MPAIKKVNSKSKEELVNSFLDVLMLIKVYHWRTKSYAEHKATDELYSSLNENIDKFVEVMLGKYNIRLKMKGRMIKFKDPSTKKELKKTVLDFIHILENNMNKFINIVKDTDLINIRDEILGSLHQFFYLLTLN